MIFHSRGSKRRRVEYQRPICPPPPPPSNQSLAPEASLSSGNKQNYYRCNQNNGNN